MQSPRYIYSLHIVALLAAATTFPLIFMGGLVTSHSAGMSVPDWLSKQLLCHEQRHVDRRKTPGNLTESWGEQSIPSKVDGEATALESGYRTCTILSCNLCPVTCMLDSFGEKHEQP